ncbi:MAG TPA: GSU2403 family nucleotidyltransferase fold protein [Enhygromyxa sp.]|nr:GSU2403 family nucleotidyltransferase fold protein [Enhygromyxa sp.]
MKEMNEEALELLRRTLRAIQPWPDQFVVVGGWAMQLYRYLEGADASVAVDHTKDVDIAVLTSSRFPPALSNQLASAGLVPIRSRSTQPPVTYFQARERGEHELAPEYVEFLVPQVGADDRSTIEIAAGVGAQSLRYLDLSFEQVRTLSASSVPFLRELGDMPIQVPSPASYLLAKSLVYEKRKRDEKRDADCAYLYWLALVTRKLWPDIRRDLAQLRVPEKWRRRGYAQLRGLFEQQASEGVVRAVRSIADPDHGPAMVHGVMRRFLEAIGVVEQS